MADPLKSAPGWQSAVEAAGPASLLVVIESRMSRALKARMTPEDIFQEALLQAWRDRERIEWNGPRAFRSWLLTVIDNRIRDAVAYECAQKRGGGSYPQPVDTRGAGNGRDPFVEPIASTTPSRVARYKEEAAAISDALNALPADLRDIVWMRLLEQRRVVDIAARLNIGASAVRHRFRRGAALYWQRLRTAFSSRFSVAGGDSRTQASPGPAP